MVRQIKATLLNLERYYVLQQRSQLGQNKTIIIYLHEDKRRAIACITHLQSSASSSVFRGTKDIEAFLENIKGYILLLS